MKVHSVSFDAWLAGHNPAHKDRSYREVYPWPIFEKLDYSDGMRNHVQDAVLGAERFSATVKESLPGDHGRLVFAVLLETPKDEPPGWFHGPWSALFHLVVEPDGRFVTLFAKGKEPGERLVKKFLRGELEGVAEVRSLPVSSMLFRSLLAFAADDIYGPLRPYERIEIVPGTCRYAPSSEGDTCVFQPFRSRGSDLWLLHAFTEEKAHRLALGFTGACKNLVVVYCHPTFTQHQRCASGSVQVISLSEFLGMGSERVRSMYMPQARFLLNHLRNNETHEPKDTEGEIRSRILSGSELTTGITTSDLREAKSGLGRIISTTGDAAYALACANLLNAALNKKLRLYTGATRLEKDVYSFKAALGIAIEQMARYPIDDVHVTVMPEDLILVRVRGLQFSFHAVPRSERLRSYAISEAN